MVSKEEIVGYKTEMGKAKEEIWELEREIMVLNEAVIDNLARLEEPQRKQVALENRLITIGQKLYMLRTQYRKFEIAVDAAETEQDNQGVYQ